MAHQRATPLPTDLARRPLRTVRPQDVENVYAFPRPELARLADAGAVHRVARGYYVVVPQEHLGRHWQPGLEAAAAGIGSAIYGPDNAILMGSSAARIHGAIPRALATAVIAVPKQHAAIEFTDRQATAIFVKRDTDRLDATRIDTQLGPALVTTPEQTILDLAHRPTLGATEPDVPMAVAALYALADPDRLAELANDQRRVRSLRRAEAWAEAS